MGSGQYGQLVGRFAREAGFDAVENEVEAEFVRPRLTTSRTSSRGAKPAWPKV
jgi:hypothetical protein